jgi:hypothetical protein
MKTSAEWPKRNEPVEHSPDHPQADMAVFRKEQRNTGTLGRVHRMWRLNRF